MSPGGAAAKTSGNGDVVRGSVDGGRHALRDLTLGPSPGGRGRALRSATSLIHRPPLERGTQIETAPATGSPGGAAAPSPGLQPGVTGLTHPRSPGGATAIRGASAPRRAGTGTMSAIHLDIPAPAPKGRNLNSLALQRQVSPPPNTPPALKGRNPTPPLSQAFAKGTAPFGAGEEVGGTADLALKRQAIQISPFQGGDTLPLVDWLQIS